MKISTFIEQDLEARIRSEERPDKITISSLAQHYDVSFSPVRAAIDRLITKKLLAKEPNGRLEVIVPRNSQQRVSKPKLPKNLDALLIKKILSISLTGEMAFLREEAVAEQLGIGRTSLRHMLSRLAGRGLLEHVPRRGWRVHPFREQDMRAYLDVRESLEVQALELSRNSLERDDLERMLEQNGSSGNDSPRLDNQLHQYFIDRSNNRYIQQFFKSHGDYYSALFDLAAVGRSVIEEMAEQHCEILSHVLNRRWAKARQSLTQHIRAQHPLSMRLVASLTPQSGTPVKSSKGKNR